MVQCYVLMSNHYHLIISTPEANLSKATKEILSRLKRKDWQKGKVSHRRALEAVLGIEDILNTVCKH